MNLYLSVAVCKRNIQSWPRLKAHALLVVPRADDLATGHYIFMESRSSRSARCYWLGATHHCPKDGALKRPKHIKTRKSRQRTASLQIQTAPHTASGS